MWNWSDFGDVRMAILSPASVRAQSFKAEKVIRQFVAQRARKEGGSPYISKIVRGDLDRDGNEDAIVNYAIEGIGGGNFSLLYIAVFLNNRGKLVYKTQMSAGSFGSGTGSQLAAESIDNGKLIVEVDEYLPQDAVCCPSKKSHKQFVLERGRLRGI